MNEQLLRREVTDLVRSFPPPATGFRERVVRAESHEREYPKALPAVFAFIAAIALVLTLVVGIRGMLYGATLQVPAARPSLPADTVQDVGPISPSQVAAQLQKNSAGIHPVLVPAALPAGISSAHVVYNTNETRIRCQQCFHINYYTTEGSDPTVSVGVGGIATMAASNRQFRGVDAVYIVTTAPDGSSHRSLQWEEPSSGAATVSYGITTTGLSDYEFWQVANSLEPVVG